ncbi:ribosome hibernation-promoting factor, HPF/YfiA family [Thioalkalivibrio sp. HK1]|uniref:ribosome hibernation-promoting factor, HPF/YfiA family n=1 Tax=Thioalkalivibrio sp. HK1 TaxID=1469245 RepID=UPI00047039BD|nr:ribosome-associated translation inhibitor RaiA [Thioalkalivibrio sp. HK1]
MHINLTGRHVDVSPGLRSFVMQKLERVARHFDQITNMHVIVSAEKQTHRAEATWHVAGADMFAEASHPDIRGAITVLIDRIDGQVRKHKDKKSDHHRAEVDNHALREKTARQPEESDEPGESEGRMDDDA